MYFSLYKIKSCFDQKKLDAKIEYLNLPYILLKSACKFAFLQILTHKASFAWPNHVKVGA